MPKTDEDDAKMRNTHSYISTYIRYIYPNNEQKKKRKKMWKCLISMETIETFSYKYVFVYIFVYYSAQHNMCNAGNA